jgi:hypothetical protein
VILKSQLDMQIKTTTVLFTLTWKRKQKFKKQNKSHLWNFCSNKVRLLRHWNYNKNLWPWRRTSYSWFYQLNQISLKSLRVSASLQQCLLTSSVYCLQLLTQHWLSWESFVLSFLIVFLTPKSKQR